MSNHWDPANILEAESKYVVILLNQPILDANLFISLWNRASLRLSVDGGGNRWYEIFNKVCEKNVDKLHLPNIACGDFDSIDPMVLEYFRGQSVKIVPTPDQDETDFTKSLRVVKETIQEAAVSVDQIVAFCEPLGAFHQTMANIQTLFLGQNILPDKQIYLFGSSSVTWLLIPGANTVKTDKISIPYISLLPIGEETTVTTTGLKWNLENNILKFGKITSTSNELFNKTTSHVTVQTTKSLICTMEVIHSPTAP